MWKNVIINFLVLSFFIFSGEYLFYRFNLQNAPDKKSVDAVSSVKSDISGGFYNSSHPVFISGVPQPLNAKTFHICGIKTTDKGITILVDPTDNATSNNLLTTSSS